MKAVFHATTNGGGGIHHMDLQGDLHIEGFSVDLESLIKLFTNLENRVKELEVVVSSLQTQNLHTSVKELATALETLKTEQAAPVASTPVTVVEPVVAEPVVESTPAPTTTSSKKKSA